MNASFGAKPAVLRCGRCGKFVDWADARVQVVCNCRPHLDLPPVLCREPADTERQAALELFQRDFGRSNIVAFGEVMDLDAAPTIVAEMNGEVAGALAYRLVDAGLHVMALATDPMWQRSGVGGYLIAEAELMARRLHIDAGDRRHDQRQPAVALLLSAPGLSHDGVGAGRRRPSHQEHPPARIWRHPDQG